MLKLNLGSHSKDVGKEWINIDGLDIPNVDGVCELDKTPFRILVKNTDKFGSTIVKGATLILPDGYADEIQMVEVLEHITFRRTFEVLNECYRLLKPGGKMHIGVPDCGKAMEYYVNGQVCDCVPHKSIKGDASGKFKANDGCFNCGGKGVINPTRWLYSFLGAQKHKYDAHLNIFTHDRLDKILRDVGFTEIEFTDDIYKLKVNVWKPV